MKAEWIREVDLFITDNDVFYLLDENKKLSQYKLHIRNRVLRIEALLPAYDTYAIIKRGDTKHLVDI